MLTLTCPRCGRDSVDLDISLPGNVDPRVAEPVVEVYTECPCELTQAEVALLLDAACDVDACPSHRSGCPRSCRERGAEAY